MSHSTFLHTRSRAVGIALLALATQACAVGPNYRPQAAAALNVPDRYQAPAADSLDAAELVHWWTTFNDPMLTSLVERTLAGNNSLAAAQARLRAARASLRGTQGAQLPSLSARTSANRQEIVDGGGLAGSSFQAGLDAAWEADLFGGLRRSTQAARANAQSSAASLADVQRSLVAEVALNYIDARSTQARLAVARSNIGIQDETLQIVRWRVDAGLVGGLDLQQAIAQRAQTAAGIPALEQSYAASVNRIAILLGQAPGAVTQEMAAGQAIPLGPDNVEAGLPADLLQRRPDLIAAERSLAAEVARIGVAEADLYPALRFSGSLSSSSGSIASLGDNIIGNLLGAITAPIFQGGQIRARIDQQRATADAALANYRGTVLTALEDVENALVSIDRTKARESELIIAETAARESVSLAEAQYQSGLIDFQSLLSAQQSLLSAQDGAASARAARASASIQLFKALGGGWDISERTDS
ncbi:MAG TPA: efflux transporter outer membrane subunit [Sphingobium sp.]|nr:efflux transporter outer membrane subunit [Sphingobium sp.]